MDLSRKKSPVQASTSKHFVVSFSHEHLVPGSEKTHVPSSSISYHFRWTLKVTRTGSNSRDAKVHMINRISII